MELVAFLGADKENWGQVTALIKRGEWDKIVLVKNKSSEEFPEEGKIDSIKINSDISLVDLKKEIMTKIKPKIAGDFEVALSIASGNGKEHMALISALLSLPVGIRLVVFTKNGIEYIN